MNLIPLPQEVWARTPPEAQAYIRALDARVVALEAALQWLAGSVRQWEATVQHVQAQLEQHARTASRPPSSDPPQARGQRPRRAPTGRRPGGQRGHDGHSRGLGPIEAVEVAIPVKPGPCPRCQHPLGGEDPQPQRHPVTAIPLVRPVVTEYQLHRLVCPVCGEATRAALPAGVPAGGFAPRVPALAARCTGAYHLAKRITPTLLEDLFGGAVGLGTMPHVEQALVQALAVPVAEARAYGQTQPTADLDDTGGRDGPPRAWLWVAVTTGVTVFVVRRSRRAKVAQELWGERCWGYVVTDRWSAYPWYPSWRRQLCWAPLWRDIDAMIARGGRSRESGAALKAQTRQRLHGWPRVRDGTRAQARFGRSMRPIRRAVERWLEAGPICGIPKTDGTCREIRKRRQALGPFVRHAGVDPTNHAAERAIRPGGLWRHGRFGTHRAQGSRFVDAMMTVVATLKLPHGHGLAYVTAACEAA
jgi:transposase